MSSLIVDDFKESWFSKNPEYRPIKSVTGNSLEKTKAGDDLDLGKSVIREGRKYTQISCQKDLTAIERAAKLIAFVAITILTAFIGLFFQSVRDLLSEAVRGEVTVDVLFEVSPNPKRGEKDLQTSGTTPSEENPPLDEADLEDEVVSDPVPIITFSEPENLRDPSIPVTATVSTNPLVRQIESLMQDEYLKSLSLSDEERNIAIETLRPDAMAKNVPALLKIMWFRTLQKNDERLQNCIKTLFSLNKAEELFVFLRALTGKSQQYSSLGAGMITSVNSESVEAVKSFTSLSFNFSCRLGELKGKISAHCSFEGIEYPMDLIF